ncbi:MAG: response regulator [Deltaproteobacteria bacterium]|jgi:FixJ family two-component response regulator
MSRFIGFGIDEPIAWVADDDPEMLALLGDLLEVRGFQVESFLDGEALAHALRTLVDRRAPRAPDLVVTDVYMPGRTGIDVLAELRNGDWSIPVIVITTGPSVGLVREVHRLGAVELLEKPFDPHRLQHLASACV